MPNHSSLRLAVTAIALALSAGLWASAAPTSERPNVVFIAVDDMNDWMGCFDSEIKALTPNIDRLVARGVNFTNAHTPGTYCAPARTSIFTGQYASTTGFYRYQIYHALRPDLVPMQSTFTNGGYSTYGTGKLFHHVEGSPDLRDWTEFYVRSQLQRETGWPMNSWSDEMPKPDPYPYSIYSRTHTMTPGQFLEWGPISNDQEEEMADTIRAEWAIDQIQREHSQPFFVGVGFYSPHHPNYCPQKYYDLYDPDQIPVKWFDVTDLDDVPNRIANPMRNRHKKYATIMRELDALKDVIHSYLACISYADAMIGRVLDAVEASPHADNTIIVLWSDHGYHFGEKGQWGKQTLWQPTTNIPFVWAGPGIAQGVKVDSAVSLIDMYPTFAELCDLPAPSQALDGESLAGILADPSTAEDRAVLIPYVDPHEYALVTKQWRFIEYKDGSQELYDIQKDPNEETNLVGNPEFEPVIAALKAQAPTEFAQPALNLRKHIDLVCEGEDFYWNIPEPVSE